MEGKRGGEGKGRDRRGPHPAPPAHALPPQLTVYTGLMLLGMYALAREPWITHTPSLWAGWPAHPLPRPIAAYYLAEGAFYTASLGMLVGWETRRADFWAMAVHHGVTAFLVAASHALRYHRVGALAMVLHDPSDVLLEAAKLASYARRERAAAALFAALIASWAVLRLAAFPRIVWSCWADPPAALGGHPVGCLEMAAGLSLLVCLHVYWGAIIAAVAARRVRGGGLADAREEEGEGEGRAKAR